MQLTLWTYEGPPHVGAMRVATAMTDVHYVLHAPQGDTYADLLFTMIERLPRRPPVTYTTFQARDLGGDVNLAQMPADLVVALRAAWARMTGAEVALHGDLRESNILMTPQGPALLGWNNARRDLAIYDAGAVQTASPPQIRARLAWEIACCWTLEPTRAKALAAEFAR